MQPKRQVADKYLDCTQRGWGITPIIGIDYKTGRWNLAARYEFTTKFNIENKTKRDDTGQFQNGVNTPNDLPGLLSLGAQYESIRQSSSLGRLSLLLRQGRTHGKQQATPALKQHP